jgi:hypothetical protein
MKILSNYSAIRTAMSPVSLAAALVVGAMIAPQSAQAALFARDLNSVGDGLLTQDTATGLDWLDVTQTKGRSYDEVVAGVGGYTTQKGFRFATSSEVSRLFDSALVGKGLVAVSTPNTTVNLSAGYFAAQEIHTLLGLTSSQSIPAGGFVSGSVTFKSTEGYVSDSTALGQPGLATISSNRSAVSFTVSPVGRVSSDTGTGQVGSRSSGVSFSPQYASFLVRSSAPVASTPEPSILLGSAAIALAQLTQGRSRK